MVSLEMSFILTDAMGFSEFSLKSSKVSNSPEILYFDVIFAVSGTPTYKEILKENKLKKY